MINFCQKDHILNLKNNITSYSLVYLTKIGEFKGKQNIYSNQQPEYLNKLQLNSIISNTLVSNNIDGLIITNKRFHELFEEISSPENNIESEIIRYVKVINLINSHYESLLLTPELFLQFHKNIFGHNPEEGGKWRDNNIPDAYFKGLINETLIPYNDLNNRLLSLCNSYNDIINNDNLVDLLVTSSFILELLMIQPFNKATGRISRLFTQILLYKSDYQVAKYYPIDMTIKEDYATYIKIISNTAKDIYNNKTPDLSEWNEFFLWSIFNSYKKLDKQMFNLKSKRGAKGQQVKLVIDSLPETFKVADIVDKCPGISRPTLNKVLQELRDQKKVNPLSLGRDAIWQKLY